MNKTATPKIIVKLVTVTPDMAFEMLEKNTRNRKVDEKRVRQYAKDMKSSRWALNGSTIVIAEDGTLLDGQHRLWPSSKRTSPFSSLSSTMRTKTASSRWISERPGLRTISCRSNSPPIPAPQQN